MSNLSIAHTAIKKVEEKSFTEMQDLVAVEEPLEVRIGYGSEIHRDELSLAVTMRTPGNDKELVSGLLITEGIVKTTEDIISLNYCLSAEYPENIMRAELGYDIIFDSEKYKRNFLSSSSCGICGKAYIDSVKQQISEQGNFLGKVKSSMIYGLSKKLMDNQSIFKHTGGLHAAALFDENGKNIISREDIGRHNALDKLIGAVALHKIGTEDKFAVLSGRIGFELVQKCLMANINMIIAIGAPSSLAVELAVEHNMCLVGFLKPNRFNIYSGDQFIELDHLKLKDQ